MITTEECALGFALLCPLAAIAPPPSPALIASPRAARNSKASLTRLRLKSGTTARLLCSAETVGATLFEPYPQCQAQFCGFFHCLQGLFEG
jgi:hypothetical protein